MPRGEYWVGIDGERHGPMSASALLEAYDAGRLRGALVCPSGEVTWQPLEDVLPVLRDLAAAKGSAPVVPAPSPTGGWYLARNGQAGGPYSEQQILTWIAAGMRDGLVRQSENEEWRGLGAHLAFAEALAVAPGHMARAERKQIDAFGWTLVALPVAAGIAVAIVPSLGLIIGGGMVLLTVFVAYADHRRFPGLSDSAIGLMLLFWFIGYPQYLRARARVGAQQLMLPGLLSMGCFFAGILLGTGILASVRAECVANGFGATKCTFSNAGVGPGAGCVRVVLTRESDGGSIRSAPICSGRLMPGSTEDKSESAAFTTMPFLYCKAGADIGEAWTKLCTVTVVPNN